MQVPQTLSNEQQYIEIATNIGLKLVRDAIWKDDKCNWVTTQVGAANGNFQVLRNSCSPYVYGGIGGISLFLAYLSEFNHNNLISDCLQGAVSNLIVLSEAKSNKVFSYYNGKLGVADVLITIGQLKNNKAWEEAGWNLLLSVKDESIHDNDLDVINGVAAVIPMLLRLHRINQYDWLKAMAERCGELIKQKAIYTNNYCSWITMPGSSALTGYSHGNTGICLALFELYNSTGNQDYLNMAFHGIAYERSLFNPSVQNWPDLRQAPGTALSSPKYAQSWCHGAPGMVLPYIRAWQISKDNTLLTEAHAAAITTANGLFTANANFSLCHGILGNAEILHTAGIIMGDESLIAKAHEAAKYGIDKVTNFHLQWPSGVSDPNGGNENFENLSLLLGTSGIGYFYLRMAYPEKVPSIMMIGG